jgi:hypothetical protein
MRRKNMRHLALFGAAVLLCLAACGGGPETADCCKQTAELKPQIPNCCATGKLDCCKQAKTDPANKADCCKKAEAIMAKMPECCKKNAAGTPQDCCQPK